MRKDIHFKGIDLDITRKYLNLTITVKTQYNRKISRYKDKISI